MVLVSTEKKKNNNELTTLRTDARVRERQRTHEKIGELDALVRFVVLVN